MDVIAGSFVWDDAKEEANVRKHGVDFSEAAQAFEDPKRCIVVDHKHSKTEDRLYCLGMTEKGVLTVRFTYRNGSIRIIGAGYWRKGRERYEKEQ